MRRQRHGRRSGFFAGVWLLSLVTGCFAPSLGFAETHYIGQELAGRNFSGFKLDGADFSRSVLRGSVFRNASLRGANFQGADLRGADLSGADLTGADLRGTIMPLIARNANFSKANLEGVDIKEAAFDKIDFSGANLRGTRGWGSVAGCNFRGAELQGSDLGSAWKTAAIDASMITGARYDDTTRWPKWLDPVAGGAKRVEAALKLSPAPTEQPRASRDTTPRATAASTNSPTTAPPITAQAQPNLPEAQPARAGSGRDMHGQKFVGAELHHEFFDDVNLQEADFTSANLSTSSFKNADLRRAVLKKANLSDVDMTGADLRDADLTEARFQGAKLGKANLEEQVLYLAGAEIFTEGVDDKMPYEIKQGFLSGNFTDSNNGYISFARANLRNTQIFGNLHGVDFRRADLRGADLTKTEHISGAVLIGAIYDSRTRWTVDPAKVGAVRGQDIAPPAKSFFIGKWAWEREKGAQSKPDQEKYATLTLLKDGSYEWYLGEGDVIKGQWDIIDAPNGLPAGKALVLHSGERKLDWIAVPKGKNFLTLMTSDHKQVRDFFRS
jgi:uncharacterized protein YjbI with pentapeptide repeats